ncbi:hypothetical protein EDD21DRAFT_311039, partial [Dissophora ornata]
MSQNSPNGDPASSPNLSASSPTSTTSKKRTRASVEQLAILEDTFLTNQSPNSKVREILAKKVKMSERSIQIWFQNRRAKVKQAQKRSELVQQEAMKAQYLSNSMIPLARQQCRRVLVRLVWVSMYPERPTQDCGAPKHLTECSPRPTQASLSDPMSPRLWPSLVESSIPTMPTFNCDNLAIGTWRRMSTSNTDLSCFYCPTTRIMTWQIIDGPSRFKMTFPLDSITRIEHYEVDPMYSQVDFDLLDNPQFFMETVSEDQQRDWKKCSDFTEGKQATLVKRHTIHGISSALKMQVMSL